MLCILIYWLTSILLITAPETCPASILFAFFKVTLILAEFFRDILRAIFLKSVLRILYFSTFLFSSVSFSYLIQISYFPLIFAELHLVSATMGTSTKQEL